MENIDIDINIDKDNLKNIDIDIDIDKDNLKNIDIDIDIDMAILENIDIDIDIDKGILQNIDIDKILYRLGFGISNTPRSRPAHNPDTLPPEQIQLKLYVTNQLLKKTFLGHNFGYFWPKNKIFLGKVLKKIIFWCFWG